MNNRLKTYILLFAILTLSPNLTQAKKIQKDNNSISLAGNWRFKLDQNDLGNKYD